jgi:hypothetical protein
MEPSKLIIAAIPAFLWMAAAHGQTKAADRLYILDCGWSHNADQAR